MSSKLVSLALVALAGGLSLVAATQPWLVLRLVEGAAAIETLQVSGQDLNPSLSPIAIAALAAALALTIAGKVFRLVLGVLLVLLGVGVAAISLGVLQDPVVAASGRLAELTAISGDAQLALVAGHELSAWPGVTAVSGIVLGLLGIAVAVLSRRWRASGRKYEAASATQVTVRSAAGPDRISDWEMLSDGEDPSDGQADPGSQETGSDR